MQSPGGQTLQKGIPATYRPPTEARKMTADLTNWKTGRGYHFSELLKALLFFFFLWNKAFFVAIKLIKNCSILDLFLLRNSDGWVLFKYKWPGLVQF